MFLVKRNSSEQKIFNVKHLTKYGGSSTDIREDRTDMSKQATSYSHKCRVAFVFSQNLYKDMLK